MYLLDKGVSVPVAYRKVYDGALLGPEYSGKEFYIEESGYTAMATKIHGMIGRDINGKKKLFFSNIVSANQFSDMMPLGRNEDLMGDDEDEELPEPTRNFYKPDKPEVEEVNEEELTNKIHFEEEEEEEEEEEDTINSKFKSYVDNFEDVDTEDLKPRRKIELEAESETNSEVNKIIQDTVDDADAISSIEEKNREQEEEFQAYIAEKEAKRLKEEAKLKEEKRLEDVGEKIKTFANKHPEIKDKIFPDNGKRDRRSTDSLENSELAFVKKEYEPVMLKEMEAISLEDQEIIIDYLYLVEPVYAKEAIINSLMYTNINEHFIVDVLLKTGKMEVSKVPTTNSIRDIFIETLKEVDAKVLKESFLFIIENKNNFDKEYLEYIALMFDEIANKIRKEVNK